MKNVNKRHSRDKKKTTTKCWTQSQFHLHLLSVIVNHFLFYARFFSIMYFFCLFVSLFFIYFIFGGVGCCYCYCYFLLCKYALRSIFRNFFLLWSVVICTIVWINFFSPRPQPLTILPFNQFQLLHFLNTLRTRKYIHTLRDWITVFTSYVKCLQHFRDFQIKSETMCNVEVFEFHFGCHYHL